jgi:protein-L-isoaspartate(D-aspartate) O-methyltransferase
MQQVSALHQSLIEQLKRIGALQSPRVASAFRAVPRHLFLPTVPIEQAYRDEAIITKRDANGIGISSSSQPAMMAIMLEQLDVREGQRVLEIGAGTGYNAALIAHIVGETGVVVTVDIDEDIVADARKHLALAGFARVQVIGGDGGLGYREGAPYDRIIVTVGAWDIAPAWVAQLKEEGRIVLPLALSNSAQKSVAFEKRGDYLESVSVRDCGFMMMRGAFAGPDCQVPLDAPAGLFISSDNPASVDAARVNALLRGTGQNCATGVLATTQELWSLNFWLALREPNCIALLAQGAAIELGIMAWLFGFAGMVKSCWTFGVLDDENLCVLTRPPESPLPWNCDDSTAFELYVRSYGADDRIAHRLIERVAEWDQAGRPSAQGLHVRAYPKDSACVPTANEFVREKPHTRLVFDWR